MANNFEINFDPDCFVPPSSNAPDRAVLQNRPYLSFDKTTDETVYTPAFRMPSAYTGTGTLKLDIGYMAATVTTGDVVWACQVEAITDADAVDLDSASAFDTANTATVTVPGTAGYLDVATITLTNKGATSSTSSAVAAGDMVRLAIYRDANAAGDTADNDMRFLYATLYEEA